jgi:hypothetical protein
LGSTPTTLYPASTLAANPYQVRIDVLLGHKKRWKRLLTFPLQGKEITTKLYGAYRNDAVRS